MACASPAGVSKSAVLAVVAILGIGLLVKSRPRHERAPQVATPSTAATWEDLTASSVHAMRSGDIAQAFEFQKQALDLVSPPRNGDVRPAKTLALRGEIHRANNKPHLAEDSFLQAVSACEKAVGPTGAGMADVLDSLANFYYYRDEFDKVAPLYERILTIAEVELAAAHRMAAVRARNLASVQEELGNDDEAGALYQRALAAGELAGETFQPEWIQDALTVANFYRTNGNYEQATALAKQAVKMAERTMGPDSTDVAFGLDCLAKIHMSAGQPDQAELLLARALSITEETAGQTSSDLAPRLAALAAALKAQRKYHDAEVQLKRALAVTEKGLGADCSELAPLLEAYADLLREMGNDADAEKRLQHAAALRAEQ